MWREDAQASWLTHAMDKGSLDIILFKTQRFFIVDKYILKVKICPMRLSGLGLLLRVSASS